MSVLRSLKIAIALIGLGFGLLLMLITVTSYAAIIYAILMTPHPPYFKVIPRW